MIVEFEAELISWRGPAPFVFAPTPPEISETILTVSKHVTYGWGVIPATVRIGQCTFTTSLFPREGCYLVPVKVAVQRTERLNVGDRVAMSLELRLATPP